ncbi:hypothetical protein RRF57_001792 [Xylaria bambusicola]|uniref:Major facilitator superfamily (MFS) profile domain-containing protein n=1 Tax=Xylaria bambusicola TaxID=326684 RepID=A0AAN7Z1W3_9PEZI
MSPVMENNLKRTDSIADGKLYADTHEISTASAALQAAVAQQKPQLLSPSMMRLYVIMGIGYLVSTMNGFDSSLMGAINAMDAYQETFGLDGAGSTTGIIFIIYQIGQIASFPFCGLFADGYGRRWCIFIGCIIVLIGTAIQGSANHLRQFISGRFILGFGASIASAAGPAYTVELAHPAYRGTMAGMQVQQFLVGWKYSSRMDDVRDQFCRHIKNSWAWRTPTIVQAGIPAVVAVFILFFPESPRWLIHNDRAEEALAIFARYHGEGDPNSPLAQLQYQEVLEDYHASKNENPWWDFRELVNTRAARYRLAMLTRTNSNCKGGNNVVSYFLPEMIEAAGITSTNTQLLINAINPIFSLIAAVYGATCLDKLGRRPMMLCGLAGSCVFYILLTAFTAQTVYHPNLSYGTIVSIYLFGICFAWGFTPLQTLYAVECLDNRTRAKGSGLNYLFLNIAIIVNTYGISIGIKDIGWRLYAGKTLEELADIFEAPNPRKYSTRKVMVEVTGTGEVVGISDVRNEV